MRFLPVLFALFLTACAPAGGETGARAGSWVYTDVRAVDAVDSPDESRDLIAVYTRRDATRLEIRLDLLTLAPDAPFDLYLALDYAPGGSTTPPVPGAGPGAWDALIVVPAAGGPRVLAPDGAGRLPATPRVVRDPALHAIQIEINPRALPGLTGGFRLQAFLTAPESEAVLDSIGPVRSDDRPPPRAPVLLAFWEAFLAYTPAQAVRAWDGAHAGPFGERHGLRNLLAAATDAGVPVLLLDLKTPAALSALEYVGALPAVRAAAGARSAVLPAAVPFSRGVAAGEYPFLPGPEAAERALQASLQAARSFGLPGRQMLYAPILPESIPDDVRVIVLPPGAGAAESAPFPWVRPRRWRAHTLLTLPAGVADLEINRDGPGAAFRRALIETAVAAGARGGEPAPWLVLGGPLPESAWGNPRAARLALDFLNGHPWIRVIRPEELLTARPSSPTGPIAPPAVQPYQPVSAPEGWTAAELTARLEARLLAAPDNALADHAWRAYFALLATNPAETPTLPLLRAEHLGQVAALVEAAEWAAQPSRRADCAVDPDLDGAAECVLASERVFALLEPDRGALVFAASLVGGEPVLWAAPTGQFVVGLGDPGAWDPSHGRLGDPGAVPDAFGETPTRAGEPTPGAGYHALVDPARLAVTFTDPEGALRKTYRLLPTGLEFDYTQPGARWVALTLPLAVGPEARFQPGWGDRYQLDPTENEIGWGLADGPQVTVQSNAALQITTFVDSKAGIRFPEDPNYDFPPGHFLPFPLAVATVEASGPFTVRLTLEGP